MADAPLPRRSEVSEAAVERLDWGALSAKGRFSAFRYAQAMSYGYSREQVAEFYGTTAAFVSQRLAELRTEIRVQLGYEQAPTRPPEPMPPVSRTTTAAAEREERDRAIVEAVESGAKQSEAARRFGVSPATVSAAVARARAGRSSGPWP